jgi:carbamoyltransferase
LLSDGVPTLVLEEERFNREKHTLRFPFLSLAAAFNGQGLDIDDIDVITTPWDMKCFRPSAFSAVVGCLPGSLNLLRPSARPTQATLIINMPMGLWWGLKWKFGFARRAPF